MPGEAWWEIALLVLLWPSVGQLGGKDWAFPPLPSLAWWGVCLHHPTGLPGVFSHSSRIGCAQSWGEGCCPPCPGVASHPLQIYLSRPSDLTLSLGHWYNTTILSKDDDIALGEQPSHRQGMGKGCMENQDTGKKHLNYLLASGQTLPNTFSIFLKREEKEQQDGG